MQQKLKQDEVIQELKTRINRLNEMRGLGGSKSKDGGSGGGGGTSGGGGSSSGGGTGLISTWKKLKGKKKKQRNLTAPEITSQEVKAAMSDETSGSSSATLKPLRENGEKKDTSTLGKGKGLFGKKLSKEKSISEVKLKSKDIPKTAKGGEIVFRNESAESNSEETVLSQVTPTILSQPSDNINSQNAEISPSHTADSKSKSSDVIILEPLSLSQTSGKHSLMSLSNEEHFSTQSSSDINVDTEVYAHREDTNRPTWEDGGVIKEEEDINSADDERFYLRGSSKLYKEFGSKQHKLNLERVHELLESSGEIEPMDLSMLRDWDGWMVATKDLM